MKITYFNSTIKFSFKTILIATLTSSLAAASTDFNWPGCYIGGYAGGANGHSVLETYTGTLSNNSYFGSTQDINSVNQSGSGTLASNLGIGGIQIGNNWQSRNIIYGLVVDYGAFDLHQSNNVLNESYLPPNDGSYSIETSVNTSWLLTARGRLGLTPPTSFWPLFYLTGGAAVTRIQVTNAFTDYAGLLLYYPGLGDPEASFALGQAGANNSVTKLGWTLGGGLEFPLAKHITLGAEYLYLGFGSVSANSEVATPYLPGYTSPFSTKANITAQLFKVVINYKFG